MTTYAPNFTPRYRVRYNAAGIEHTIQMRGARGESGSAISGRAVDLHDMFLAAADILADDFAWISAEIALTDSDVFTPASLPGAVTGLKDVADFNLQQRCVSTGFVGRAAGSRAAIYMYGLWWSTVSGTPAENGRATVAEWATVTTITAILNTHAFAGSGELANWHNYANLKLNDHLLKLLRRGTIS
jgi:hypothetical protein